MNDGVVEQLGTQVEIYNHPKSMFVATFIGEAKVLRATVVGLESTRLVVRISDGVTIFAPNDG
jgi:spermidine/putrescine transport system ATP-binding protein